MTSKPAVRLFGNRRMRDDREALSDTEALPRQLVDGLRFSNLSVRLAKSEDEIVASQRLRYRVFYEEMSATPTSEMQANRRDYDDYDNMCDHLLVLDLDRGDNASGVVGTYRLLRREPAAAHDGFYTAKEFDISPLEAYAGAILEVGRSCVDVEYRSGPTMQLLWRGIAGYIAHHEVAILFGCASFPGTNPEEHAEVMSYLHHFHLAPPALRPTALPERYVSTNFMPASKVDRHRARSGVPPLIKGYIRLGGVVGEGAVIDEQFDTTDVCIVVNTDLITDRYFRHYQRAVVDRITYEE